MTCAHCAAEMPVTSAFCPACGLPSSSDRGEWFAGDRTDAVLGAIAYFAVLPAILLLAVPAIRSKHFLRFHCWQALLFAAGTVLIGLALKLLFMIAAFLPAGFLLFWLLLGVSSIAVVLLWMVLVIKALQGYGYELPVIGPVAARLAA